MFNLTRSSVCLSNVTSSWSSLVLYLKSFTAGICPPDETPQWYCIKDFHLGPTAYSQTGNGRKYLAGGLCLWAWFVILFRRRAGRTITPLFELPARNLHRLPPLLQSYLTSSPFTLTLNAVFQAILLAMFHESDIPWSHRFKAVHIFSSSDGDAAALSAMKRNLFSLVWTITLSLYAPMPSGMARIFMISWTILSLAAFLVPSLALLLSNGEDLNTLNLAIKAQGMGNDKGQRGHLLWYMVNIPAAWQKKFQQSEIGFACWCHALVVTHVLYTQYTTPPSILFTSADGSVRREEPKWTYLPPNSDAVPTAFTCSLAVAWISLYLVSRNREKDIWLRGFSASLGSYHFANQLKDVGFSCTWALWLGSDGMLWAVDQWVSRMQRKRLQLSFEKLAREGLE